MGSTHLLINTWKYYFKSIPTDLWIRRSLELPSEFLEFLNAWRRVVWAQNKFKGATSALWIEEGMTTFLAPCFINQGKVLCFCSWIYVLTTTQNRRKQSQSAALMLNIVVKRWRCDGQEIIRPLCKFLTFAYIAMCTRRKIRDCIPSNLERFFPL